MPRYALVEGLKEKQRIGVNPFQFGFSASTDTHSGTPGAVEERRSDIPFTKPSPRPGINSGGLVAVWAEENSRDSIFKALKKKEVYGTSGSRMAVRLFAGKTFDADICSSPEIITRAYDQGVPMGGAITPSSLKEKSPEFLLIAQQDPGTSQYSGNSLHKAQIIKGWADAEGRIHQKVIDIAGGKRQASVNKNTCEVTGSGYQQFCTAWRDPDFNPNQEAVYYARVLESPSCRSTGWVCRKDAENRPDWCNRENLEKVTQERAWTSPIWYQL